MSPFPCTAPDACVNIDTESGFLKTLSQIELPSTRNFLVEFDANEAHCVVDIDPTNIINLFKTRRQSPNTVRWLNFWSWDSAFRPAFEQITTSYGISPRLAGLIWPQSSKQNLVKLGTVRESSERSATGSPSSTSTAHDLEKAIPLCTETVEDPKCDVGDKDADLLHAMGLTDILNALWHFCSVDSDRHYRYVGCNQLYVVPGMQQVELDKPSGIRIWTSLILCDDGTVISVSEQPRTDMADYKVALKTIRQNSINVFKHLSKLNMSSQSQNSLHRVTIRPKLDPASNNSASTALPSFVPKDTSSILFYYLFDDWMRSFRLIAGFEHPYRKRLGRIRKEMFGAPDVDLIHSLHQVGKQLVVLQSMYQSYELIINRILYRQRISDSAMHRPATLQRVGSLQPQSQIDYEMLDNVDGAHLEFEDRSDTNVGLSPAAIVRFERLLDRVRLYALTEIENCLKEKDELVFMVSNFSFFKLCARPGHALLATGQHLFLF